MPKVFGARAPHAAAQPCRDAARTGARASRLAATFSLVARDPRDGSFGIGVASHSFAVGARVPWAEPGVGVLATQAFVAAGEPGAQGLALLREGRDAASVLAELLAADPAPELRQLAIVDGAGAVAAHTGERCIGAAAHRADAGFCVQGNTLPSASVLDAMAAAHRAGRGDLAERLLGALAAGEAAGGDLRGRRSAALLVVSGAARAEGGRALVDLRVDDHAAPLAELARLLAIRRAGERLEAAFLAIACGDLAAARSHFVDAQARHPENAEYGFWAGVTLANAGCVEEGIVWLRQAFAADPSWRELLTRLPGTGLLGADEPILRWIRDGAR